MASKWSRAAFIFGLESLGPTKGPQFPFFVNKNLTKILCKRNRALQGPPPNHRAHYRPSHMDRRRVGNIDWGKGRPDLRQLITAYRGPNYPLRAPIMAPFAQIIHIQMIQ